ncbi:MAG: SAM-dependent methyltransferase [Treponemataceae bacterium]
MKPRFYFSTCQAGAEKVVKAEITREYPQLRFAFSRPGFVTFKEADDASPPLVLKKAIFTRLWGEVLGQAKDKIAFADLLSLVPAAAVVQCFERDQHIPGEEPPGFVRNERIRTILKDCAIPEPKGVPNVGDAVYSLIWIDDFHVFLGRHIHSEKLSPLPGNLIDIPLPADAPSRAYLKIEEAIQRFKPTIESDMRALEIGCAPGGASSAMLKRGLKVTGVDPQYMAETVYSHPGFSSIRLEARHLTVNDLRNINPDWLVMDMSIAPLEALDQLSHVVSLLKENFGDELKLCCGFLTIKLNDWSFASSISLYMRRIDQIGFRDLRPMQLCGNRQEFFVWAPRFDKNAVGHKKLEK